MANVLLKSLQEIGLTPFSIKVYLSLTELKEPNVTNLAKSLSVDRAKIYNGLSELKEFGLIATKDTYSRFIELLPPNTIVQKLKQKELKAKNLSSELIEALPDLNYSYYNQKRTPLVKIYEGKTQFINLYEQVLEESGDTIEMFGNTDEVYDLISFEFQQIWSKQKQEKNIFSKLLVFPSNRLKTYHDKNDLIGTREIRWLPQDYFTQGNYWLFGAKTIHWNPVIPKAIVIEDKIITETMRSNFNYLWDKFEENKYVVEKSS